MKSELEKKEQRRYLKDIAIYILLMGCFTTFSFISVNVITDLKKEVKTVRAKLDGMRDSVSHNPSEVLVINHSDTVKSHDTLMITQIQTQTKVDTIFKKITDTVTDGRFSEIFKRDRAIIASLNDSIAHLRMIIAADDILIARLREGFGKRRELPLNTIPRVPR